MRIVALLVALAAPIGCGGGEEPATWPPAEAPLREESPPEGGERAATPEPVLCPPDLANCRSAAGEIVFVEAVDPDGDGDAHFVLLSRQSVTAPGISVIDVARELRPRPLPRPGDALSAAGPVYRGSYGQRQIEATEIRVARR